MKGIDAAQHCAADRLGTVRMGGDREAIIMRGSDHGTNLLQRQLRIVAARAFIQHAARGHDLDHVVAELVVLAHRLHRILRPVDDPVRGT